MGFDSGSRFTASRPITWFLALLMAWALGETVLRWALWPVATFEDTRDIGKVVFGQTYRAARKLYSPPCDGRPEIVLLGNSRVQFAAREEPLRAALREIDPERDYCVLNLGVFGAAIGDLEVIERHVAQLDPALVVLALDETNLRGTSMSGLRNVPASLMSTGWADGPIPAAGIGERIDRWLRTSWSLYRFREFVRGAIMDRVRPDETSHPWPRRFDSMAAFFRYAHGDRAAPVIAAYERWRVGGDLASFVEFLEVERAGYLDWVRSRAAEAPPAGNAAAAENVMEALLARMSSRAAPAVVVMLPRNPLLDLDRSGELFDRAAAAGAIARIEKATEDNHVPLIDARTWMPAEAFFDFDHLVPDVAGFEERLAAEVTDVLRAG